MDTRTHGMRVWTKELVAVRFKDAADIGRLLPPAKVQGYFNSWPPIIHEVWASLDRTDCPPCLPSPRQDAIDRMLATMRWLLWLEHPEERHLILDHAKGVCRNQIAKRCGISRTTVWRRWQSALQQIVDQLNHIEGGTGVASNTA
jgi:uncharacterized protein DUF6362